MWPIPRLVTPAGGGGPAAVAAVSPPVISQEWRTGPHEHLGVDLMYRAALGRGFAAPPGVPIVAARAGKLWSVDKTPRGWAIVLDHGPPWATFYQHLQAVDPAIAAAKRGDPVELGQPLGVMGSDPTDGGHIRHLHFATWYKGYGDAASVDPAQAMATWPARTATRNVFGQAWEPRWLLEDGVSHG